MGFDTWLDKAWNDHAADAEGVAARIIGEGMALTARSDDVSALARLAHHVYGEHLGRYADGRALLGRLAACEHGPALAPLLGVLDASLGLAGKIADERAAFDGPARIRITALAASSVAAHDSAHAGKLLREAIDADAGAALDDRDPACRALAVAGNQIACSLESTPARSDAARGTMILAAQTARQYWARAGTWLETERAEYRLAQTWRHAGDFVRARRHAQECLEIVRQHGSPALEVFFGWEALCLAERDAGNAMGHAHARAKAREAFACLEETDRGWCQSSLAALEG